MTVSEFMNLSFVTDFFKNIANYIERRREYKRTFNELHALTDRELNDIGINRGMIRSIVEEMYNPNLKDWV